MIVPTAAKTFAQSLVSSKVLAAGFAALAVTVAVGTYAADGGTAAPRAGQNQAPPGDRQALPKPIPSTTPAPAPDGQIDERIHAGEFVAIDGAAGVYCAQKGQSRPAAIPASYKVIAPGETATSEGDAGLTLNVRCYETTFFYENGKKVEKGSVSEPAG